MIGNGEITLSWNINPNNPVSNIFAGVRIAQTTGSIAPDAKCTTNVVATTTNTQSTSHTITTGLTNDTAYSFRICARNNDSTIISSGVSMNTN